MAPPRPRASTRRAAPPDDGALTPSNAEPTVSAFPSAPPASPPSRRVSWSAELRVIDKPSSGFLDSKRFVTRLTLPSRWCALAALVWLCGCSPQSATESVEDSITSGRITVVCAPEAFDLVVRMSDAFEALYPKAEIEVTRGSSRDAVGALFGARCDLAVITRELEQEEREAAVRGGLDVDGYRFARDAVRVIANRSNPIRNVAIDDLRGILRGDVRTWQVLGGSDVRPVPVLQTLDSDVTRFWMHAVMGNEPVNVEVIMAQSDSAVVEAVRRDPRAFGYLSSAVAPEGVTVLRLATLRGLPYFAPDQEAVHRGEYPLTRFDTMYVRPDAPPLTGGFITYVTSIDGQRMVMDAGLVPTAVPVRFVRRSPLKGSH